MAGLLGWDPSVSQGGPHVRKFWGTAGRLAISRQRVWRAGGPSGTTALGQLPARVSHRPASRTPGAPTEARHPPGRNTLSPQTCGDFAAVRRGSRKEQRQGRMDAGRSTSCGIRPPSPLLRVPQPPPNQGEQAGGPLKAAGFSRRRPVPLVEAKITENNSLKSRGVPGPCSALPPDPGQCRIQTDTWKPLRTNADAGGPRDRWRDPQSTAKGPPPRLAAPVPPPGTPPPQPAPCLYSPDLDFHYFRVKRYPSQAPF